MPALPDVANVIKSRLFWTVEGDPMAVSILFWHYTSSPPTESDIVAWDSALGAEASSDFLPLAHSGVTLASTDSRDLSSMTGAYISHSIAAPGTRTGSKLSPGTAAVVNYSISQHYRGGKPRSYYPFGVSADISTTGLWADAFVTAYQDAAQTMQSNMPGAYGGLDVDTQCVVSYYGPPNRVITNPTTGRARTVSTRRDAPGGTGHPLVYRISNALGSKRIGSQRRRNRNA